MNLYEKPAGVQTHWISFENAGAERGRAGLENAGAKGHAFDHLRAGETKTLLDVRGSGTICRIWATIGDRSPEMLRSLRLEMFWDGSDSPAVSVPFGDFFGVGVGRRVPFENALFSDPEGRSFNCFVPMPFRTAARVTLANDSSEDLGLLSTISISCWGSSTLPGPFTSTPAGGENPPTNWGKTSSSSRKWLAAAGSSAATSV